VAGGGDLPRDASHLGIAGSGDDQGDSAAGHHHAPREGHVAALGEHRADR
jgi:hypothetical protein